MVNGHHASRGLHPHAVNGTEVRNIYVYQWGAIPDTKHAGPLERPAWQAFETAENDEA